MAYNEDQPRDDRGRWGSGGGGGSVKATSSHKERTAASDSANKATQVARSSGKPEHHAKAAEAHRAAVAHHSSVFKSTEDAHKTGDSWSKERQELHKSYAESTTKDVPTSDAPTAYMTGGGPASGKSTGLLHNPATKIPGKDLAAHIDPDGAKAHIPEYNERVKAGDKTAASFVHEESSHMAKEAVKGALGDGHDVVYDSVGDSGIAKLSKKVQEMRDAGAKRVVAHYATVDVEEAIKRSDKRAERTGRFVPHEYIRQAHADVARTSLAAIETGLFDEMDLFDTSGEKPVHVASFKRGSGLKIHDQAAWDRHKKRGES